MNNSRKMTIAAAALVTGAVLFVRRMRKPGKVAPANQPVPRNRHATPAFAKMKDRHRNNMS